MIEEQILQELHHLRSLDEPGWASPKTMQKGAVQVEHNQEAFWGVKLLWCRLAFGEVLLRWLWFREDVSDRGLVTCVLRDFLSVISPYLRQNL